jgi:hypothetical protein
VPADAFLVATVYNLVAIGQSAAGQRHRPLAIIIMPTSATFMLLHVTWRIPKP